MAAHAPVVATTELGATALYLIACAYSDYTYGRGMSRHSKVRGRIRVASGLGLHDPREVAAHSCYLRLMSVTEAFLDARHQAALSAGLGRQAHTTPTENLLQEHLLSSSMSWKARVRAFRDHHGVDISTWPRYAELESAIWVRNAVAHGLGRLTRRQLLDLRALQSAFPAIHVHLMVDRVIVSGRSLAHAQGLTRGYVAWVDMQLS